MCFPSSLSSFLESAFHLDSVDTETQGYDLAIWFDRVVHLYGYIQHGSNFEIIQIRAAIFCHFESHHFHLLNRCFSTYMQHAFDSSGVGGV